MTRAAGPPSLIQASNRFNSLTGLSLTQGVRETKSGVLTAADNATSKSCGGGRGNGATHCRRSDERGERLTPGRVVERLSILAHHRPEPLQTDSSKEFDRCGRLHLQAVFVRRKANI